MPLYDYVCPSCNYIEEVYQRHANQPEFPPMCPQHGLMQRKIANRFSFRGFFKWYKKSDYGNG